MKSSSSYMLYYFYIKDLWGNWYKNFVDTQKIKGRDLAQGNRPWALHGYERPMAHGNAFTKKAGELSKMGQKPKNERKKRKGTWKQDANDPIKECKWRGPWNETCLVNKGAQKGSLGKGPWKAKSPKRKWLKLTNDPTKPWDLVKTNETIREKFEGPWPKGEWWRKKDVWVLYKLTHLKRASSPLPRKKLNMRSHHQPKGTFEIFLSQSLAETPFVDLGWHLDCPGKLTSMKGKQSKYFYTWVPKKTKQ